MKIFKRFLPLIFFLFVFVFGLIMLLKNKNLNIFSQHSFFILSLLIIGGIGIIASFFIILSSKPLEHYKNDDNYSSLSSTIKNELSKINEEKTNNIENKETQILSEPKHKKIKCSYCKCRFDNSLSRCPNCGAPPENED